jgi:hypothetical protein
MRTREKPRYWKKEAPEPRFVHLGSGFFLDKQTGQVIAL